MIPILVDLASLLLVTLFQTAEPPPATTKPESAENPVARSAFTIDDESVTAAFATIRAAYAEKLALEIPASVKARIASADEVAKIVAAELEPQYLAQCHDAESARRMAQSAGAAIAPAMLAKYAVGTREILVLPDTFESISKRTGEVRLLERESLLAVLAHECAHALDHEAFDWPTVLSGLGDADAITTYNAILEGHAQFQGRELATRIGVGSGFDAVTASIVASPFDDSLSEMLARCAHATNASAYVDGEKFIAEVMKEGGAEAVERAFREPPSSPELIERPEWYLHPERRPVSGCEIDAGLDRFVAEKLKDGWTSQRITLTAVQAHAALAMLPDAEAVARTVASIVASRVQIVSCAAESGPGVLVCGIMSFATRADALAYRMLAEELGKLKDESLASGPVMLKESKITPVDANGVEGIIQRKRVEVSEVQVQVVGLIALRGRICVEMVFTNVEATDQELIDLGSAILDAALAPKK